jgi:predicted nucleic acid-binding protein
MGSFDAGRGVILIMRTAIDTNIISAIWSGSAPSAHVARVLAQAANDGALVICAPVYVELMAYPNATAQYLDQFLASTRVNVDFLIEEPVWRETAQRFTAYVRRRRKSGGGESKRLLADFLIGAHALLHADRLFTLDPHRFERDFPKLRLI